MLVKMPRGPAGESRSSAGEEGDPFEVALRRDLASTPVISYESTIGGWSKRAFDLVVTLLTAPLWLTALLFAWLAARQRHNSSAIVADERIGYGGRVYNCYRLRLDRPVADIVVLHPGPAANESAPTPRPTRLRRVLERLPQLFNVLRGDMSLVGPAPLTRAEVEPLKTAKRYYLSARPGVVGVSGLVGESEESAGQYKVYSLCWSLPTDMNLLLAAFAGVGEGAREPESASNLHQ